MKRFAPIRLPFVTLGVMLAAALGLHLRAQTPAAGAGESSPWTAAAQFTQGYDSNVTLAAVHPQGDSSSQLALQLGGNWQGPRWGFFASYDPAAAAYLNHPKLDYFGQSYSQDLSYAASTHTKIDWSAAASHYPQRGGLPGVGAGGLAGAASASQGLGQASVLTGGSTSLSISQQYSQFSSWSASVNGGENVFSPDHRLLTVNSALGNQGLNLHTLSFGGNLGWSHQVSEARTLTLGAGDSEIRYGSGGSKLRYVSAEAGVDQKLGGAWTAHLGGGPSWTQSLGGVSIASLNGWGYAADTSLTTQQGRTTEGVSWQHSTRASLAPGGLATDTIALQFGTQWGHAWSGSLGAGYSRLANALGPGHTEATTYTAASLSHRLATAWWFQASASFNSQPALFFGQSGGDLRRVEFNLGVRFQPLGAR